MNDARLTVRVDRWDRRRDGRVTESALRHKIGAGYRVSILEWAPGTILPASTQFTAHVEAVAAGMVRITVDDESAILTAGDVVYVPRGAVRRAEVVGPTAARVLASA